MKTFHFQPTGYFGVGNPLPGVPDAKSPQGKAVRALASAIAELLQSLRTFETTGEPLQSINFVSECPHILTTPEFKRLDSKISTIGGTAKRIEDHRISLLQTGFDVPEEWLTVPVWVQTSESSVAFDEQTEDGRQLWQHRCTVDGLDVARINGVLESLKSTLIRLAALEQSSSDEPRFLGLVIDRKLRLVRRVNFAPAVQMARSDTAWPLFEALFDSKENGITAERAASIHETGNRDAIRSAIRQICEKLLPLGITVTDGRAKPWKLAET